MAPLEILGPQLQSLLPVLLTMAAVGIALWLADRLLRRRETRADSGSHFTRQIVMLALTALGIIIVVLGLPVAPSTRGQLLSLLGLVLTAMIAFSSTTFVSNAMAGLMLRNVESFRVGDFVRVADQFGRVTERGLFHTEIQTEDRDLTTLPNLYLVSNPMSVVRASGTVVSCTLSLGYDTSHRRIEALLLEAAALAELEDGFVQIRELGDHSVSYRVAGFLVDVRRLVTTRSRLRAAVLDTLHAAGIEIVSPQFMAQRPLREGSRVIPASEPGKSPEPATTPEDLIFDTAAEAESMERLREQRALLAEELGGLEGRLADAGEADRPALEQQLARGRERLATMDASLATSQGPGAGEPTR